MRATCCWRAGSQKKVVTRIELRQEDCLAYRELIGVLAHRPSAYVKLEIRLAISLLLCYAYLHAPMKEHFKMALRTLMYTAWARTTSASFTQGGLDEHGVGALYAYADSNFESPKSTGGRQVYMNGAIQHGGWWTPRRQRLT
jgi:hypothetical protein